MANMSYCRFQNTKLDLEDCVQSLHDRDHLSDEEYNSMKRMREIAEEFLEASEDYENPKEED